MSSTVGPIIGICNTWSELTPCNAHFRKIAEHVKRGISEAGGFPVEFPVFSNGESNLRPTAMLTRNLASMDVEEAHPRQPDRRRGAAHRLRQDHARAADGRRQLQRAGHRRHRRANAQRQAGRPRYRLGHRRVATARVVQGRRDRPAPVFVGRRSGMSRSAGTCNTMGTASTMACMAEALGTSLPHNAAIPAVDARRYLLAQMSGMRVVEMAKRRAHAVEDPHASRPSRTPFASTPPSAAPPTR